MDSPAGRGRDPGGDDLDGLAEEGGHEHLAADVGVDADQVDARAGGGPLDRLAQVAGGDAEAELGVGPAGLHELVGVGLHAGWPAAARSGAASSAAWSRSSRSSSSKLSTTMRPTPTSRAQASSASLLLLPWHQPPVHARGQGHVQLAAGGDVEVEALLDQAGHGQAQERLAGVGDAGAEGVQRRGSGREVVLVVDEQGPELGGQVPGGAAGDGEPAVADPAALGSRCQGSGRSLPWVTWTPGRPRRAGRGRPRPMRDASTSHRRAWVMRRDVVAEDVQSW